MMPIKIRMISLTTSLKYQDKLRIRRINVGQVKIPITIANNKIIIHKIGSLNSFSKEKSVRMPILSYITNSPIKINFQISSRKEMNAGTVYVNS